MKVRVVGVSVFLGLLLTPILGLAKPRCTYSFDPNSAKLTWTAFKTTQKVPVKGSFSSLQFLASQKAATVEDLVRTVYFEIDARSVDTKNKQRDATLVKSFFSKFKGSSLIEGYVRVYEPEKAQAQFDLYMNRKKRRIPMKVKIVGDKLTANGDIDVLHFALDGAMASLNKACKKLHAGKDGKSKTWSTVGLMAEAKIIKKCEKKK